VDEIDRAQMYDEQLRASAEQVAVARARRALQPGSSRLHGLKRCRGCGEVIPAARRHAVPAAVLCLGCATASESKARRSAGAK